MRTARWSAVESNLRCCQLPGGQRWLYIACDRELRCIFNQHLNIANVLMCDEHLSHVLCL